MTGRAKGDIGGVSGGTSLVIFDICDCGGAASIGDIGDEGGGRTWTEVWIIGLRGGVDGWSRRGLYGPGVRS